MVERDRWYTVADIVAMLGVHEQTVRRWLKSGELTGSLLGRKGGYRIHGADLHVFISKRRAHVPQPHGQRLTPERRAEIDTALRCLTPGWYTAITDHINDDDHPVEWGVTELHRVTAQYGRLIYSRGFFDAEEPEPFPPYDAFFIEQSPTIIRELLAEIDRLTALAKHCG